MRNELLTALKSARVMCKAYESELKHEFMAADPISEGAINNKLVLASQYLKQIDSAIANADAPPAAQSAAESDLLKFDSHLRFIQRVLEGDIASADKATALNMIREIRTSVRPIHQPAQCDSALPECVHCKVWENEKQQIRESMCDLVDDVPVWVQLRSMCSDYENTIAQLRQQLEAQQPVQGLDEYREIVEAVAHIGIDFGYGPFALDQSHIDKARALLATHAAPLEGVNG